MKGMKRIAGAALAAFAAVALVACGDQATEGGGTLDGTLVIKGAGATFPQPLYERWIETYRKEHSDVVFTY